MLSKTKCSFKNKHFHSLSHENSKQILEIMFFLSLVAGPTYQCRALVFDDPRRRLNILQIASLKMQVGFHNIIIA